MAAVGTSLNLRDVAAMKDPSGKMGKVAEILTQANPIIDHIPWSEGKLDTGDLVMVRKTLGGGSWRRINEGTAPSKATQTQVNEVTGIYDDWIEADKKLLELSGDAAAVMLNQFRAHAEAATQEIVGTLFYGNVYSSPKEFHGLLSRMDALNTTPSAGPIVLDAGGAQTDNLSIVAVCWGEGQVKGIYPKNAKAGLQFEDYGYENKTDSTGKILRVRRAQFIWEAGLAVEDYRFISALRNIDISALASFGTDSDTSVNLVNQLIDLLSYIPNFEAQDCRLYVPRLVWAGLTKMAQDATNRNVTRDVIDGKFITNFFGAKVHMCDALTTETTVIS